jgi:hypothetical protein
MAANQKPIEQEAVTLNDVVALLVLGHIASNRTLDARDIPDELVKLSYNAADAFVAEKERRAKS